MIFAETDRLILRTLAPDELPRLTALFGVWDVVRWISIAPFPYALKHAEEFYADMATAYQAGEPQFYAMALKRDNLLIGGIGLHPPRNATYGAGAIEIGYWLAKDFWGQGLMSEAMKPVISIGFARPATQTIIANTAPTNHASQKVLRKAGLVCQGEYPRDYQALRGDNTILKWQMTRADFAALTPSP